MQVEEDEKETPTEWRKGKKERQIYRKKDRQIDRYSVKKR